MDSLVANGRALPYYASIPATLLALAMLFVALRSSQGRATRFVIFAIWLRFILSAFHPITFSSSPVGLSYNALGSIFICGFGLWVLRPRGVFDVGLVPFYPILLVIAISGFVNHSVSPMVDMLVKYVYMAVIILAVVDAITETGWDKALGKMFLPFLILVAFQALSVVLGVVKASEADGSASYIGGFNHEAAFSVALAGGLFVLALRQRMSGLAKTALVGMFCLSILLANYRTAIVAIAPLLGGIALIGAWRGVIRAQRMVVIGLATVLIGIGGVAIGSTQQERFADIATVIERGTSIIKPPREFDLDDRHVMSGRPLIWSQYIYGYRDSSPIQHVIGSGPNAWNGVFVVYAHNTLVSALYELGVLGVLATLFFWIWMFALAAMAKTRARPILLCGHLSFFLLNMATMPLWQIEGMILYGILCGCTVQAYISARKYDATKRRPISASTPYTA